MKSILLALTLGASLGLAALSARAAVVLSDDFAYSDGALTNVSGGKWSTHSGTGGQADVAGGVLNVTEAESEDVNAPLKDGPYAAGMLYASFRITFTALPSGTGGYFAHFKDSGTGFRAKLFATTTGAAAGSLKLGVSATSNTGFTPTDQDVALNTTYRVVLRVDASTMASTLWLDPTSEADAGAVTSDTATAVSIAGFAFRQSLSSGNGVGTFTVDDLIVGTEFAEVLGPVPPSAPIVTQHPQSQTVLEGSPVTFTVAAIGTAPLSYQWRRNEVDIADANAATYTISSVVLAQAGTYDVVVSNAGGSATTTPATLTVDAAAVAPTITQEPAPAIQTVAPGASVTYTVTATGTEPLSYQWFHSEASLVGQTAATLTLTSVTTAHAGTYKVTVSNTAGSATSTEVTLNIELPPPATIASLRETLDPTNLTPTNTTTLFTVEGVVTTHVNLTGPGANVLFYMQDVTAGIAVFWSGGTNGFIPSAGDRVRVTAPLTHFNGLLELGPSFSNAAHSVTRISAGNPLPAPVLLDLNWQLDPLTMERYEGSYVVVSNVLVDLSSGPTFTVGRTNGITDEFGMTFVMYADARTDVGGQAKPTTAVTILGVLGQFDNSNPRDNYYQVIPTRFADILSASKAPTVRSTNVLELIRQGDAPVNTYSELVLQPGEKITITATITDPDGRVVTLSAPTAGLPPSAQWTLSGTSGTELQATFMFQAAQAQAGQLIVPTLVADNGTAINNATWKIYVPTADEQQVTITEFLANPTTTPTAPHFNPLQRTVPSPLPSDYSDEYVEVVNLSATDLDLAGWTISDSASLRHKFYESFPLTARSSAIIYGGPLNGLEPGLDVPTKSASENPFFGFNDTGGDAIILRNAEGNIICRLVYTDATLSASASVTRVPDINGPFLAQNLVSANPATPGRQFNGTPWTDPAPERVSQHPIGIVAAPDGAVTLSWTAVPGLYYTVWQADTLEVAFSPRAIGLTFTTPAGQFTDGPAGAGATRFYWISTP